MEWATVSSGKTVVATDDRAWLHDSAGGFAGVSSPFARPMSGHGSPATTRRLLDGALSAARVAVPSSGARPKLTFHRWVFRLAGFYHTTHATPRLMAEAARRFAMAGRMELSHYAERKVIDEGGHDRLALLDLRDLGLPAERVVARLVPPAASALVAYFERAVQQADPIGSLGYAYALERMAATTSPDYTRAVNAVLPPGVNATRCLRVHSGDGTDADHVEDLVDVVARSSAEERSRVAVAVYETGQILMRQDAEPISDEAIERAVAEA